MTSTTAIEQLAEPTRPTPRRQLAPGDRVVICGGGPAGLTAAYILAQRGYAVRVLEADDVLGGISRTARYKDYRFDIGGHRFFTKITPVEQFWEEILGDQLIDVPRLSRILYNGQYFHYPLKAVNAITGLGLWEAGKIIVSYVQARISPSIREDNLEQWVSNRFGSRLYQIFFKTYTEKVWGIPCTEIRAEWAAQRIQGLSLAQAILSATSLNKRSTNIKTLINKFRYPRLGPGQMWEMCAGRIVEMGGVVSMGSRVRNFKREKNSIKAVEVETSTGVETIEAEHFISTIPLAHLALSIGEAVPAEVTKAADGLTYRDFILVALILEGDKLFPDNWIYIHTPGVLVGRIQNFNNWSADMVPAKGVTCLGMEYFCFEGDGQWNKRDADLIALATKELETLGLAPKAKVVDGAVVRMPKAYPIYDADYSGHVDTIRTHLDSLTNIQTVGRNGMHKYNNQDHSMYTAMLAVENMLGAEHDVWAVNTDLDYHEEQRLPESAHNQPVENS
ncbi:MAG TPA: NAD(P)/FAD-dependent oxidoreductase [Gemmatimonadaceae bacterium]|nr:NAD(P)/FAD-dependent oxidoreductase [Gemmatimonadaceae bacterium]